MAAAQMAQMEAEGDLGDAQEMVDTNAAANMAAQMPSNCRESMRRHHLDPSGQ